MRKIADGTRYVARIEQGFGVKPEMFPDEGVGKVSFPQAEVKVVIDNKSNRLMGLTSWVSFQKGSKKWVEAIAFREVRQRLCAFFPGSCRTSVFEEV